MQPQPPSLNPPPPPASSGSQRTIADNLRLLAVFHYILGGIICLLGLLPLIHLFLGGAMFAGSFGTTGSPSHFSPSTPIPGSGDPAGFARAFGLVFMVVALISIVFMQALGAATVYAGFCLSRHQHYMFTMVVAGLSCTMVPFGTVLGIFTLILLTQPDARALYGRA